MSRAPWIALFIVLFAGTGHAQSGAAPAAIGVLPPLVLGAADAAQQSRIAAMLADGTHLALGVRRRALPLVASCDPSVESRCLALEIEKVPAISAAAQLAMERGAHAWILQLRVFGRDGQLVGERRMSSDEADAARDAQDLLLAAFDPARHTGRVAVRGLPSGARVTLDGAVASGATAGGAPVGASEDTREIDDVPVGKHIVAVIVDGAQRTFPIDVEFDRTTEVLAGPLSALSKTSAAPMAVPPLAQPVAIGGVVTGLAGVTGALALWIISAENRDEWERRASGSTFPRNRDDPLCASTDCVVVIDEDEQRQVGWTRGYGPLGAAGQVGQGARFMMVGYSRDNQLRWSALNDFATAIGVGAILVTITSSAFLLKFAMDEAGAASASDAGVASE